MVLKKRIGCGGNGIKEPSVSYGLLFGGRLGLGSRLLLPVEQPRLIPSFYAEQVREEINHSSLQEASQYKVRLGDGEVTYIERDERNEDTNVSPPVRVLDVE